jgi:hypothetical protein
MFHFFICFYGLSHTFIYYSQNPKGFLFILILLDFCAIFQSHGDASKFSAISIDFF